MTLRYNWQEFAELLRQHGISTLYHFTDRDNLESIIRHGGLYSRKDCVERAIPIVKSDGGEPSCSLGV